MAIKIRKKSEGGGDEDSPEDQARPDDPVLSATSRTAAWISRNRASAMALVVALLLAVIGVYGALQYMEQQKVEASDSLTPAFVAYSLPIKGTPTYQQLQSAEFELPDVHESYEAKWSETHKLASETLEEYQKTDITQPARLTKASSAMRLGKWDEAVEAYEAYLEGKYPDDVEPFVRQGLATAYAGKGDVEAARKQLGKLAEIGDKYSGFAKYQEAKLLQSDGRVDEAKELYHEILETDPKTPFKSDIERRLALL